MSQSEQTGAVTQPPTPSLVVGIGASAGGVEALQAFFSHLPADSGCAYVVILHLSPEYESNLAAILQNVTPLPITALRERTRVEPNHVYVVSPSQHLTMVDSFIAVTPTTSPAERRAPVDLFFRTLADSHESRGVCVILSGSGSDGSLGLKQVKERGGAVFVQQPDEAIFAEMPRSAIATDLADAVLPVAEIPARIVAYAANAGRTTRSEEPELLPATEEQALRELVALLRARTGHDFSQYKRPTLFRRIERRVAVHTLPDLPAYAAFLRDHPEETRALLNDLLISVTNFFRDPEAFAALEREVLPKLLAERGSEAQVRLWVAGCATGEEAYSLAMLCAEQTEQLRDAPRVQIFATDIDEAALARARAGVYTAADTADIPPERLRRFFIEEQGRYRVRPELRELILFASHNLLTDPPFSQLDLVSCRNLLIYLERGAQERVLETFHFALRPDGVLLLGSAETADSSAGLFATIDREQRLFQRRSAAVSVAPPLGTGVIPTIAPPMALVVAEEQERVRERLRSSELHRLLLEQYGPPSLVVTTDFALVHLSERAGRYLQLTGGEPTNDLLALIRPELRDALRNALFQAVQQQTPVEVPNLSVRVDERTEQLTLRVRPALRSDTPTRGFLLVLFEPEPQIGALRPPSAPVPSADEHVLRQLGDEVQRLRQQLRFSAEQYEVQTEELKSANEELQALNEELRTAAEEQTTSREELQSVNEELRTLNQELKVKVEEAVQTSANLQNLVNATNIATIFLDRQLRVRLFTPAARALFNLIPLDQGRPLADITHRLEDVNVLADAEQVFATLQTVEREVRAVDGRAYVLRVLPYRVGDDRIGGVVLTFFDITECKRRERQQEFLLRLADALRPLSDADEIEATACGVLGAWLDAHRVYYVEIVEAEGIARVRRQYLRAGAASIAGEYPIAAYSWTAPPLRRGEAVVVADVYHSDLVPPEYVAAMEAVQQRAIVLVPLVKDGRWVGALAVGEDAPRDWNAEDVELARETLERLWAAAQRARAEAALRASEEKYRTLFDSLEEGVSRLEVIVDEDERVVDFVYLEQNHALTRLTGLTSEITGRRVSEVIPDLEPFWFELYGRVVRTGTPERVEHVIAALDRWFEVFVARVGNADSRTIVVLYTNITERKRAEARQAFLLELSDALRAEPDAPSIKEQTVRMLGEHLHADRCYISEVFEQQGYSTVGPEHLRPGVPPMAGTFQLADYPETMRELTTKPLVIHDAAADPRFSDAQKAMLAKVPQRALLVTPLRKGPHEVIWALAAAMATPRQWTDGERLLLEEVAERTWAAVERVQAEHALRESEAKYRTLFDSIDEGFLIHEMIRDEAGRATDLRMLEVNAAFTRQTGLGNDLVGKLGSEFLPNLEQFWLDTYDRVARTGIPERVENYNQATDRWYNVHVSRTGRDDRRVAVVFEDITERKRAEERQAFLLHLGDAMRAEQDGPAMAERALRLLAEHLRLDRAYIAAMHTAEDWVEVAPQVQRDGLQTLPRTLRPSDFPEGFRQVKEGGLVVTDIATDPTLSDRDRQSLRAIDLIAFIVAAVRKGERNLIWALVAGSAQPRSWTPAEVRLVQDVAERTWAAVERARAEEALRASEGQLRALIANLPGAAAFIVDRDLRYMLVEGAGLLLLGSDPNDFLGKTIFDVLDADQVEAHERNYRGAFNGEPFVHEHDVDGHTFVSRGVPLRSANGDIYAVLAVSYDITDRKRAEAALRASEERFRTLADTVPQLIWTNDAEDQAIYFNQRWYAYSGLSYDQSAGLGWQAIVHPDDEAGAVERWRQAVSSGTLFETEYRLRGADGSYRWHLGRNVPLRNENGAIIGWFGSATDIEAVKQAEAARQESAVLRRLAEAQEEERLRIARDLHDQLGQQITGLLLGLKQLEGPVRGTSAAPLLTPLQELARDLAKESHRIAVNLRPTALEDVGLVPALERLVASWSEQTGVPAGFESMGFGTERLPQPVEVALYRVVQEALTNVGKHAEATNVSVLVERRADQVSVIVEDNGRGFAVDAPAADERPHLGVLGMRERVAQVGGTLEIEVAPGSGTTIFVRIPRDPSAAKP